VRTGLLQRVRLRVRGAVQGVGYRPFVYRLAQEYALCGWVSNDPAGVTIEAEGPDDMVAAFVGALRTQQPPSARVDEIAAELIEVEGATSFVIQASGTTGARTAIVLPDLATCDDCMSDVCAADNRRAGYAFTNCTNCGPRFSIIRGLPYDRSATTMAGFTMCEACAAEYADPRDRRFHAQPNACPACGPHLRFQDSNGTDLDCDDPIAGAAAALRAGQVVAVKGLGGFHLMVRATDDEAVMRLRSRKRRPAKPLAVMVADVAQARRFVIVDEAGATLLASREAPIVLLQRRNVEIAGVTGAAPVALADAVAPDNPYVGVMLPATPLHHLLLAAVGDPLVATGGNVAEEPICTDETEAVARLRGVADLFLVHDRPIERHVDDSVVITIDGAPRLLRRARGFAPLPVLLGAPIASVLAVGPHLKNTIAVSRGRAVFISQHIGDLETPEAQRAFDRVTADLLRLYEVQPAAVAHDLHPDYVSTGSAADLARGLGVPCIAVQHHHAHLAACMAENGVTERTLGVVWDGTGYGTDGVIWGGEFLLGDAHACHRAAHLLPFRLPGGAAAIHQPWRVAVALLHATFGADAVLEDAPALPQMLSAAGRRTIEHMITSGLNSPVTTSAGRLFDGVAALIGLCGTASYEGEPAIRLEHMCDAAEHGAYDLPWIVEDEPDDAPFILDWRPMVRDILTDLRRGTAHGAIAARVHNALSHAITLQAELTGCPRVALSGGCFQNRRLTERTAAALRRRGFTVLQHRQVPANDGGVSLGQVVVAAARLADGRVDNDPAAEPADGLSAAPLHFDN
jgi:hydrogenase maturation protein HypF